MKKYLLITFLVSISLSYAQETYLVGKTEYYFDKYYSSTGKPVVKRSEANKKVFLKSKGYLEIPEGYEIDHITPLCEGGSDDPSNMQLLTIDQHKAKTARERTNRSYYTTYTYPTYTNYNYEEPVTTAKYSRTDSSGRIIYTGNQGGEYYLNSGGNKVYVNSNSTTTNTTNYYTPAPSSNREIQTGPRGGQYYINSNGNKTYIKK